MSLSKGNDTNSNRNPEDISNQSTNNRLETLRQWLPWAQPSTETTLPTSYSTSDGEGIEGLSCPRVNEVLSIIKSLNKSKNATKSIEHPQLVVVGTQSSGKSSVLNNIIQWDILPTGQNMVTRTPLQIELIPTPRDENSTGPESTLHLGEWIDGTWKSKRHFPLKTDPTQEELQYIHSLIESETIRLAGKRKDINNTPIYLQIRSPRVPSLTLVDLPGLTMVACTDQGQPADIKGQISSLISEYLTSKRTLIMAVMPARCDLEADAALELIKQHDPHGERSVGVLTKVDLMNKGTDISEYLEGTMSRDLKMKYGYFAVRNRSREEMKTQSLLQGLQIEKNYFSNHAIYQKFYKNTGKSLTGITALRKNLSQIYYDHLKKTLPQITNEVEERLHSLEPELAKLGSHCPDGVAEGHNYIYSQLTGFCNSYRGCINDRREKYHIGREIKEQMVMFRKTLENKVKPFDRSHFSDKDLLDTMERCEGNQMSVPIPTIEVLENCLGHRDHKPFHQMLPHTNTLIGQIKNLLLNLATTIVKNEYQRYPVLSEWIVDHVGDRLHVLSQNCVKEVERWVEMESYYIWTDNKSFRDSLQGVTEEKETNQVSRLRQLLISYYECILSVGLHQIPKIVMYSLVKQSIGETHTLFQKLNSYTKSCPQNGLHSLLVEPSEIGERRAILRQQVDYLHRVRDGLRL